MSNPDSTHGILATSRYIPRMRLERSAVAALHAWMAPGLRALSKGCRAVANWDEDSITMAVEACRALRSEASLPAPSLFTLASTTLPFADRLNAGVALAALGLRDDVFARDAASSMRAASTELLVSLRNPAPEAHLLVAAEQRIPRPASTHELICGHGAAAALTGRGRPIATLVAAYSAQADFVDHFRARGDDHDYYWEERWVRDEGYLKIAVSAAESCLRQVGVAAGAVTHFVMPAPLPKVNEAVAKKLGLEPKSVVATGSETVGDMGCAQPLAMLDVALRQASEGELILLVAFGNGCDALLLRRSGQPCPGVTPDDGVADTNYMKYLSFSGLLQADWGMRAEMDNKTALSAAWRGRSRTARFEGGRCRLCGTAQFPAGNVCVNPQCKAQHSLEPLSFADLPATVLSHTSDHLAYTPHPPFRFGHIDFDGGGRVLMEFADTVEGELRVGLPVRMVYRIKELDPKRGFRRYFWKATPVRPLAN